MKRRVAFILALVMMFTLCACGVKEVKVQEIFLSSSSVEVEVGETYTLTATVIPEDHTEAVKWVSANTEIASINEDGLVTALKEGKTTVICSSTSGVTVTCEFTVVKPSAIELLNENETNIFNFLIEKVFPDTYNASAFRIRNIYYYGSNEDLNMLVFDVQAENRVGGTIYAYLCGMISSGIWYDNGKDNSHNGNVVPTELIDYAKINLALEEYWKDSGI